MVQVEPFGQTVLVNGFHLTSAIDRIHEAQLLAAVVPEDAADVWVYGPALGDAIRLLLTERPCLRTLHVVTMSREIEAAVPADRSWEADPRVQRHLGRDVAQVYGPFVCSPIEVRMADEDALPLRDRICAVLNQPFNDHVRAIMQERWAANAEANRPLQAHDRPFGALFGTDRREAVVIGGGPTAAEFYGWMREQKGHKPLVAASTALKPLLAADIVPDFVVVLDRLPVMRRHFPAGVSALAGVTLVYHQEVHPEIPHNWPGPRVWMKDGDFYPGGSVIHAEIDLALKMGAPVVHLLGADFCYPRPKSHMDGAALATDVDDGAVYRTINGEGRSVPTDGALTQYQRAAEDMIAANPTVRWVKYGRAGVVLKGAEWAASH